MRYSEIMTEATRFPRKPSPEILTKAARDGFDISRLWFHGTRRRFDDFRLPKERGIDELGPGVYLTSIKWLANTWARDRGFIAFCVIRQGPLFDLETINRPESIAMMRQASVQHGLDTWFGEKPDHAERACGEFFDENFKRKPLMAAGHALSAMGYVGGFKYASQIAGQVVIFKPEDVRIVARQGGKRYMASDD